MAGDGWDQKVGWERHKQPILKTSEKLLHRKTDDKVNREPTV